MFRVHCKFRNIMDGLPRVPKQDNDMCWGGISGPPFDEVSGSLIGYHIPEQKCRRFVSNPQVAGFRC